MHGPDGTHFPNESIFSKLVNNQCIELEHIVNPHFRMVISFEVITPSETSVEFLMIFDNKDIRDRIATYAIQANQENYERLEKVVSSAKN